MSRPSALGRPVLRALGAAPDGLSVPELHAALGAGPATRSKIRNVLLDGVAKGTVVRDDTVEGRYGRSGRRTGRGVPVVVYRAARAGQHHPPFPPAHGGTGPGRREGHVGKSGDRTEQDMTTTSQIITEGILAEAYETLTASGADFAYIADMRRATQDRITWEDFNAALTDLFTRQEVNLIPQSCQMLLTDTQRGGALLVGGEMKHRCYWG